MPFRIGPIEFVLILVIYVIPAWFCLTAARRKGINFFLASFLAIAFPVIGWIIILALPGKQKANTP